MALPVVQEGGPPQKRRAPFIIILLDMAIPVRGSVLRLAHIGAVEQMFGAVEQVHPPWSDD